MPLAAIGLGANVPSSVGEPRATLTAAIARLSAYGRVTAQSAMYRTAPVGYREQPDFVNAVVLLETQLAPLPLLEALLAIERSLGRNRSQATSKGPRTLDLDLLLYGDMSLDGPALTLPHPAMHQRRFVLAPLAEIAPGWRHPLLGRTMADLLEALPPDDAMVARISG